MTNRKNHSSKPKPEKAGLSQWNAIKPVNIKDPTFAVPNPNYSQQQYEAGPGPAADMAYRYTQWLTNVDPNMGVIRGDQDPQKDWDTLKYYWDDSKPMTTAPAYNPFSLNDYQTTQLNKALHYYDDAGQYIQALRES